MAEHPNAVRTPHVGGASIPCLPACTAKGVEMAQQGSLGVFSFEGYDTFTKKAGLTSGEGTPSNVDFDSHHVLMNLKYWETHWLYKNANNTVCNTYDQWNEKGIWQPAGGQYIKKGQQMWGQLSKADQDAGKTWRADGYNALKALKTKATLNGSAMATAAGMLN